MAVLGIMIGIFLYEYTDFFAALRQESIDTDSKPEFSTLTSLISEEIKLIALIFISGFTLFSPYVIPLVLVYKGFMTGFATLYYGMQYRNSVLDTRCFIVISTSLILTVIVFIIMGAKGSVFGSALKYAAPDISFIFKQQFTKDYFTVFLLMTAFLVLLTASKYFIVYI